MPEVSGLLACACPVASYIDHVILWHVRFSFVWFFSAHEVLSSVFFPLLSPGFVVVVVVVAVFFFLHWGLIAGLPCCASHGGIISM